MTGALLRWLSARYLPLLALQRVTRTGNPALFLLADLGLRLRSCSPTMAPQTPTASAAPTDAFSPSSSSGRTPTWLGPGIKVRGEILGDEDLSVEGNVEGPISLGGHRLTVGSSGRVAGEVVAREVVVYGAIDGDVRARDRIEVKKAGSVIGDLTTARIVIEDGAYFKGHIEIDRGPQVGADLDTFLSRGATASSKELKDQRK